VKYVAKLSPLNHLLYGLFTKRETDVPERNNIGEKQHGHGEEEKSPFNESK
jgi:hypothetical protein